MMKIVVFGVENAEDYNKMKELDVYAIYTNSPETLKMELGN